ncbi:MAG: hypothetical protein V1930_01535 [Pseudomonadota bacterium]
MVNEPFRDGEGRLLFRPGDMVRC